MKMKMANRLPSGQEPRILYLHLDLHLHLPLPLPFSLSLLCSVYPDFSHDNKKTFASIVQNFEIIRIFLHKIEKNIYI